MIFGKLPWHSYVWKLLRVNCVLWMCKKKKSGQRSQSILIVFIELNVNYFLHCYLI
jgi:hypothetical protein